MGIQIIFSKRPATYYTTTIDKLKACFELVRFFHKGLFFPQYAEVWFSAPSEALGGSLAKRTSAANPYEATNLLYEYLKELRFEDISKTIILFKGVWEFNETKLAGYFSVQNDAKWREVYGDIEISAYAKKEFGDLVDALWHSQPVTILIRRFIRTLKTAIAKSSLSLSEVTFSRGVPTREDPTNLMAIYALGERRGLLSLFYTALRQSKDRNVIFKAKPLNTRFLMNALAKEKIVEERITKRLQKAIVEEIRGRSAIYIAKDRNSFEMLFKEISETILKPALHELPKEEYVKEMIHKGLKEYREQE